MSEEALQIAEEISKKQQRKGKVHPTERTVSKNNKELLSEQCKEMEEHNALGKTNDLFKEMRDNKGTFHAKRGTKRTEMGST